MGMQLFSNPNKGRRILQAVIFANVICLVLLVFHVFNFMFMNLMASHNSQLYSSGGNSNLNHSSSSAALDSFTPSLWASWKPLLWAIGFFLFIFCVAVQLTFDLHILMYKTPKRVMEQDEISWLLKRVQLWMRISTRFLVLSAVIFSGSLFVGSAVGQPALVLALGFGGLGLRLAALAVGHQYFAYLSTYALLPFHFPQSS